MSRFLWFTSLFASLGLVACSAPDTDQDYLSDSFEELIGTNPEIADSDGDGFTDAEEYLAYYDPDDRDDFPYEGGYPRGPVPSDIDADGWDAGEVSRDWEGEDQHGDLLSLHKFFGNVIMIDIGAEWCGPCQAAAPEAEDHYQDWKDRGFIVFGLLIDGIPQDTPPDIDRWIEDHDLTYPLIEDSDQDLTENYIPTDSGGSFGIPLFAFIGRDLTIEIHGVNRSDWEFDEIEELLDAETPYVEWPMPENTIDLRAELGIAVGMNEDTHLQANIDLTVDSLGAGSSVNVGSSGGSTSDDSDDDSDSEGGADTSEDDAGVPYNPSNSDGTYSRPPWGGAACSAAGQQGSAGLGLVLGFLALLGLRRRS